MWISTCGNAYFRGEDLHILLCISTCGNSLKTVQIRVRGNTLFLMWTFTLNCVSPHAVIHQKMCKSAQQIYTYLGAFPQVEIHNYKCKSSYAENQSLVNFLVLGNTIVGSGVRPHPFYFTPTLFTKAPLILKILDPHPFSNLYVSYILFWCHGNVVDWHRHPIALLIYHFTYFQPEDIPIFSILFCKYKCTTWKSEEPHPL